MADLSHIKLIHEGRQALDQWRKQHPRLALYLDRADFSHLNLADYDLSGSHLKGAKFNQSNMERVRLDDVLLDGADFGGADLEDAVFVFARAKNANFEAAHLHGTTFRSSVFEGGSMRGARLNTARFHGCNLHGVDFTDASIGDTVFAACSLKAPVGLKSIQHMRGSQLSWDTIAESWRELPEEFLRGTGLPDELIRYLPSIIGAMLPIQFYSCFISHSSKDHEFSNRLHGRLKQEGLQVWFAPEDMKGGQKSYEQIDEAIRIHDKLLLVLSEASMESEWVKTEIRRARRREVLEKRQVLFPIRLVPFETIRDWTAFDSEIGKDMAVEIREYHIPDFSNWKDHDSFEAAFRRLLADLMKSAEVP